MREKYQINIDAKKVNRKCEKDSPRKNQKPHSQNTYVEKRPIYHRYTKKRK